MAKLNYSSSAPTLPHRMSRLVSEIRWLAQILVAVFVFIALLSYSSRDPSWIHAVQVDHIANWGGRVGAWLADMLLLLFGVSAYGWVVLLLRRAGALYRLLTESEREAAQPPRKGESDEQAAKPDMSWIAEAVAFVLLMLSSSALESLRLWSLRNHLHLPRSTGGVLGDAFGNAVARAFGFTGGTLVLLFLFAVGLSLFFRFSWLSTAEKLGGLLVGLVTGFQLRQEAVRDRKLGEVAAERREGKVEQVRVRFEDHEPVMIVPPVVTVAKSERAEKEKQVPLFGDLPDSTLPPLALLDAPAAVQETIAADTLEYTSRLIEKKLKDFGVEVSVVAAYPGPVVTRYEIEPATGVKGSQIVNLAKDLARAL